MCWRYGGCVLCGSVAVRRNAAAPSMMLSVLEALAFFFDGSVVSARADASEAKKKIAPTED